jgi:hypothetical protein
MYPSLAASFCPAVTIATKVYVIVKGNDLMLLNKLIYRKTK